MRKFKRFLLYTLIAVLLVLTGLGIFFYFATKLDDPHIKVQYKVPNRVEFAENAYSCGDSWLRKNEYGLWELYVSGKPFERGIKAGLLTKELIEFQEYAFLNRIEEMIPSRLFLNFLKYFLMWFNKDINEYIPEEYLEEIYGISQYASADYQFIGSNYGRILNYHAAHDVGHALQNMNLVGCTSFALWGSKTESGGLLVGRNFDFYVGDEFAKNKIIEFVNPDKGNKFAFITWGGMIGVVSGMNDKGLTVTINAAKSSIPSGARTPVSILAREILQYASNIRQAYEIAAKRETFVSESFLIASAEDKKAVIIEKTPKSDDVNLSDIAVYENDEMIVCTNHFQSGEFKNSQNNKEIYADGATRYRYERTLELLAASPKLNYLTAAEILRNSKGKNNTLIGLGNEKAVNQFIAHHSVIFEPEKRLIRISSSPYQLGKYLCYDLNKIFANPEFYKTFSSVYEPDLSVEADSSQLNYEFREIRTFKKHENQIRESISSKAKNLSDKSVQMFVASNPEYFQTYKLLGDYYMEFGDSRSENYYRRALSKEISNKWEADEIKEKLQEIKEK